VNCAPYCRSTFDSNQDFFSDRVILCDSSEVARSRLRGIFDSAPPGELHGCSRSIDVWVADRSAGVSIRSHSDTPRARDAASDPGGLGENSAIAVGSELERGVARDTLGSNTAGTHLAQRGPPCNL